MITQLSLQYYAAMGELASHDLGDWFGPPKVLLFPMPVSCPFGCRCWALARLGLRSSSPAAKVPERAGDLALAFVGGVQVDHRGPRAAMTHTSHQFAQIRASMGSQRVSGMP